jgi:hypothetical protein
MGNSIVTEADRKAIYDIYCESTTGEKFISDRYQALSGGCINQTTKLSDGKRSFFVKTNMYLYELNDFSDLTFDEIDLSLAFFNT